MSREPHRASESTDDDTARRWARFAREVSDAAVAHNIDPSHPLVRFGKYELLRVLGEGGYGMVFHGRDPKLDREVAIKFCLARDERTTRTLTREAQTLAKLKHPNIVAVYELGEHGKEVFIAMEYVAGSTVDKFVRREPTPEAIVRIFCDVGRGLAAAHDLGIVHRDVKPTNILIDHDDIPRIADFGLARLHDPTAAHRTRFTPSGTPAYMAPEVLRGQMPDALSDQWSFGVSLWEMLTKEPLFDGHRPGQVLRQIEKQLAAKLAHERVPTAVLEILRRALAIDPRERYPSMPTLVTDLARLLPPPVSEPAPGDVIELRPIAREAPVSKAKRGVVAVALVLVGALGWAVGAMGSGSPRASTDLHAIESTPADSPCLGVRRGEKLDADRVVKTACEMIRDGDIAEANDFWDREYKDRFKKKEARVRLEPEKTEQLALELAETTLPIARTFLDQAENLSRDRTKATVDAALRCTLLVVLGPLDPKTARRLSDEIESRVIYGDMRIAAEGARLWASEAAVGSLGSETEEIEERALALLTR